MWSGTLTAMSSIAHGGETRGTITLLRRELMATPDGTLMYVPIVSGNTLRGRLRRLGEELLRDALQYEGLLDPAAAHALRGGGSLAKTSHEPLSGSRLQSLRALVPQIAVFGAAGGGTIIGGALDVGKVVPHLSETRHITGVATDRSAFTATQLESYTRQDDTSEHDFTGVVAAWSGARLQFDESGQPEPVLRGGGNQMLFHLETFPAGTVFSTWLRLRRPTDLEAAFFHDVLTAFTLEGRLGGRVGIGHGLVRADLTASHQPPGVLDVASANSAAAADWRTFVQDHREEILIALKGLT
jgi:hypothetical protein